MAVPYFYFAFMGIAAIGTTLGLIMFFCPCCRARKQEEERDVPEGHILVMDGDGNLVLRRDPNYHNPHDYSRPFGTAASEQPYYTQSGVSHRGNDHERPVTAIVAGRGPYEGRIVQDPYSQDRGGYSEPVEYGEAVYVSQPEGHADAENKYANTSSNTTGRHPPPPAP